MLLHHWCIWYVGIKVCTVDVYDAQPIFRHLYNGRDSSSELAGATDVFAELAVQYEASGHKMIKIQGRSL